MSHSQTEMPPSSWEKSLTKVGHRAPYSQKFNREGRLKSALALTFLLVLTGCATDSEKSTPSAASSPSPRGMTPVIVSSELVVGTNRVVLGLLDENDAPASDPDIEVVIAPVAPDGQPGAGIRAKFVWMIESVVGVYVLNMEFPSAKNYNVLIQVKRGGDVLQTTPMTLDVAQQGTTPAIGSVPPAIETPTASTLSEIAKISTDTQPIRRFYRYSVDEALEQNKPFVVVFATPKFCVSAVCGPTLTTVKDVAEQFPEVNFIHVEPYELPAAPDDLQPSEAAEAWGLPSEPYVFVIDAKGRMGAKYEGALGASELTKELSELTRRR